MLCRREPTTQEHDRLNARLLWVGRLCSSSCQGLRIVATVRCSVGVVLDVVDYGSNSKCLRSVDVDIQSAGRVEVNQVLGVGKQFLKCLKGLYFCRRGAVQQGL